MHDIIGVGFSLKDEVAGEVPVAFVVRSNGSKITEDEIKQYVSQQVLFNKIIGFFHCVMGVFGVQGQIKNSLKLTNFLLVYENNHFTNTCVAMIYS